MFDVSLLVERMIQVLLVVFSTKYVSVLSCTCVCKLNMIPNQLRDEYL